MSRVSSRQCLTRWVFPAEGQTSIRLVKNSARIGGIGGEHDDVDGDKAKVSRLSADEERMRITGRCSTDSASLWQVNELEVLMSDSCLRCQSRACHSWW